MTLAFVCVQLDQGRFPWLDTGLEILQLILGQKVCHYLDDHKGGKGVKANGDKR